MMRRRRHSRPVAVPATFLLALSLSAAATADVVQLDVAALLDADVVVNDGNGGLDPTQSPIDGGRTRPATSAS
jgi:hypothetical protein